MTTTIQWCNEIPVLDLGAGIAAVRGLLSTRSDARSNGHFHLYADSEGHGQGRSHRNPSSNSNSHAYTNPGANAHCHTRAVTYPNAHTDCHTPTDHNAHTTATIIRLRFGSRFRVPAWFYLGVPMQTCGRYLS